MSWAGFVQANRDRSTSSADRSSSFNEVQMAEYPLRVERCSGTTAPKSRAIGGGGREY